MVLKMIYFAFVYPQVLYGIEVYANTCKSYLKKLAVLNNKLLRIVQNRRIKTRVENHKTLKNSQTAADRRVKHKDTKIPSSVDLSNSDTISDEWHRLQLISASGLFCQNEKMLITRKR
jgi:hypothetical protein